MHISLIANDRNIFYVPIYHLHVLAGEISAMPFVCFLITLYLFGNLKKNDCDVSDGSVVKSDVLENSSRIPSTPT